MLRTSKRLAVAAFRRAEQEEEAGGEREEEAGGEREEEAGGEQTESSCCALLAA
jgi:hypothetical protein